eukprot:m.221383 g.221383  ORF g.221383 m.221383 type:complete len:62 (+) comp15127_c0_seq19:104-289(+)
MYFDYVRDLVTATQSRSVLHQQCVLVYQLVVVARQQNHRVVVFVAWLEVARFGRGAVVAEQ